MRERLFGHVDEPAALDELAGLRINYDPARSPEHGAEAVEGHWHVDSGSTVIGRGDQANLRLPDVGISRRHARLDYDGAQVVLTDLGSTNGTMVNGQRVSAVALNPGDMIQLGTTTLTFRVDG